MVKGFGEAGEGAVVLLSKELGGGGSIDSGESGEDGNLKRPSCSSVSVIAGLEPLVMRANCNAMISTSRAFSAAQRQRNEGGETGMRWIWNVDIPRAVWKMDKISLRNSSIYKISNSLQSTMQNIFAPSILVLRLLIHQTQPTEVK